MYRICLFLCILKAMALEDSDEAKYIDLLPEAEKQEFLNRIARRILEEIQSKDSPEQPQAEVTDDQLRVHDAYVQDILKEESENLKKEKENIQKENYDHEENDKDFESVGKVSTEHDTSEKSEKRHDIDLTLQSKQEETHNAKRMFREVDQNVNENLDISESLTNVIPVKVVYDKSTEHPESLINTSSIFTTHAEDVLTTTEIENTNEQYNYSQNKEIVTNSKDFNESRADYVPNLDRKDVKVFDKNSDKLNKPTTISTVKSSDLSSFNSNSLIPYNKSADNFQVFEEQIKNNSNKHDQLSDYDIKKSDEKENSDSLKNISLFTNTSKVNPKLNDSLEKIEKLNHTTVKSDVELNRYITVMPSNNQSTASPIILDLTTFGSVSTTVNSKKEDESKDNISLISIAKTNAEKIKTKFNASEGIHNRKQYIRKKLDILSEEYSFERVESYKNDVNKEQQENKEYYVYEVPEGKSKYLEMVDSKKDEEPYYIPIYNFAPKNAYYDARNLFGPNNEEDIKEIQRSSTDDGEEIQNELFHLLRGFRIDLNTIKHQYNSNNNRQNKRLAEEYRLPSKAQLNIFKPNIEMKTKDLDNKYSPNFDMDYYFDRARLRSIQGENERIHTEPKSFDMDYFDDLRRDHKRSGRRKFHKQSYRIDKLPNSSEEDHPYYSIHKNNIKNHLRAIRKLLFRQKKFGFMSPTPYAVKAEPRSKTKFMAGNTLTSVNNDEIARRIENNGLFPSVKHHGITMDYFWGRIQNYTQISKEDFDDNFSKFDDTTTESSKNANKIAHRPLKDLKMLIAPHSQLDNGVEDSKIYGNIYDHSLDAIINVLRDLIQRDHSFLLQYDWLLSTVDVEAALMKLRELMDNVEKGHRIHPLDSKLLNYIIYLYNTSNNLYKRTNQSTKNVRDLKSRRYSLRSANNIMESVAYMPKRSRTLPKTKQRKPGEKIKNPVTLWRSWLKHFIRIVSEEYSKNTDVLGSFKTFLDDLGNNLYDLHIAIKHIALITTYQNKNWYNDLKTIYLKTATRKQLLQVLLHLSTSKLITSIEESAKKGAEDYGVYVKNNRDVIRNVQKDFVFVLKVLDELKKIS